MGIAVHYPRERLYWLDKNLSVTATALRSCAFDGTDYRQIFLYRNIDNVTHPANVTDLKIEFVNNTAFFIDSVRFPYFILML